MTIREIIECNICGKVETLVRSDSRLPTIWLSVSRGSGFEHWCPKCAALMEEWRHQQPDRGEPE